MITDDIPADTRLGTFARMHALLQKRREIESVNPNEEMHKRFEYHLKASGIPLHVALTDEQAAEYEQIRKRCIAEYHEANYARSFQLQVIDDELQQLANEK